MWKHVFLVNSSPKDGIRHNKYWEQQSRGKAPSKWFFIGAISKPYLFIYYAFFASFVFAKLHSILNMRIFPICVSFPGSSIMFSSMRVQLMSSPICYGFGKIQRWTTPCITTISSRIGSQTILRTTVGTLIALKIVPRHLKLRLKKSMNLASKRSLLALGVQTFKQ